MGAYAAVRKFRGRGGVLTPNSSLHPSLPFNYARWVQCFLGGAGCLRSEWKIRKWSPKRHTHERGPMVRSNLRPQTMKTMTAFKSARDVWFLEIQVTTDEAGRSSQITLLFILSRYHSLFLTPVCALRPVHDACALYIPAHYHADTLHSAAWSP